MVKNFSIKYLTAGILLLFICLWFYTTPDIFEITFLTSDKYEVSLLNKQNFTTIYGAPHYGDYKSYLFDDGKFIQNGNYVISTNQPISNMYTNALIASDDEISNYKELRNKYGQVSFVQQYDEYFLIIFDGFFLDKPNENYKISNIVYLYNDGTIRKYQLPTEITLFFNHMHIYENNLYLVGVDEKFTNNGFFFETILYEINSEGHQKFIVDNNNFLINYSNVILSEDLLYMTKWDNHFNEIILCYNLTTHEVLNTTIIPSKYKNENSFSKLIYYNNYIIAPIKPQMENFIEIRIFNKELELISNIEIEGLELGTLFSVYNYDD